VMPARPAPVPVERVQLGVRLEIGEGR
jgi:hypothetical protein